MLLNGTNAIVHRRTLTLPNEPRMYRFLPVNGYFIESRDKGVSGWIALHVILKTRRKKPWMIVNDWSEKGEKNNYVSTIFSRSNGVFPMARASCLTSRRRRSTYSQKSVDTQFRFFSDVSATVTSSGSWFSLVAGSGPRVSRELLSSSLFSTTAALSWAANVALDCSITVWKLTKVLRCSMALCQQV